MRAIVFLVAVFFVAAAGVRGDDFALRDGDTVAFLGDSITAARTYGKHKLDMGRLLAAAHLKERDIPRELSPEVQVANAKLEEMQRLVARPRAYRFAIRKAADAESRKSGG